MLFIRTLVFTGLFAGMFALGSCSQNKLKQALIRLPQDTIITIHTYDGSNEVVHPDIVFDNDTFYMAITPYPKYNDKLENPSVYISTNGINFMEPAAGENPLSPTPAYDHNNDPDLIRTSGEFRLIYLETMRPDSQNVVVLTGNNFRKWARKTLIHYDLKKGEPFIVSPAMLLSADSFYLFYVNIDSSLHKAFRVEYLSTSVFSHLDKSKRNRIQLPLNEGFVPWHVDALKYKGEYLLLCCCVKHGTTYIDDQYELTLFSSNDMAHWRQKAVLNCNDCADKSCRYMYRSTALAYDDTLAVWYSFVDSSKSWKLGFKKIQIPR
jgi:hypothetical protein